MRENSLHWSRASRDREHSRKQGSKTHIIRTGANVQGGFSIKLRGINGGQILSHERLLIDKRVNYKGLPIVSTQARAQFLLRGLVYS